MKQPAVYIMASKPNGTLYIGVTSNLAQRVYFHKAKITQGFTARYGCCTLVYYELLDTMESAIAREKYLKSKKRAFKLELIHLQNPRWEDLCGEIF